MYGKERMPQMPKNKFQEVVFTILMCLFMVIAMELYNASLIHGGLSGACVPQALLEMRFMLPLCFVTSFFLMDPLAQKIAFSQVTPGVDHPLFVTLVRSGVTVSLMCPAMSFWATLIFHGISWSFPAQWLQTVACNFPMALCWQIFFCGPLVRRLFGSLFCRKAVSAHAAKHHQPRI